MNKLKRLPIGAKRIMNTHLQDTQHPTFAPYVHRAIFRLQKYAHAEFALYAYSHLPIVAWKFWEVHLLKQPSWLPQTCPKGWDASDTYEPFEYWWPPIFSATENFALQRYDFHAFSWTIVHGSLGHPTDQLRLHWQHENKIHPLPNNRALPDPLPLS